MSFFSSKESDEWYTPVRYINAVLRTLGEIDLDPASTPFANQRVGAARIYTATENALERAWKASTVFCNPPFSRVKEFVLKMDYEHRQGHFQKGMLLCNASTSERWFQILYQRHLCFTNHRIRFVRPDGSLGKSNTKGQVFVLYHDGQDEGLDQFHQAFEIQDSIGTILARI